MKALYTTLITALMLCCIGELKGQEFTDKLMDSFVEYYQIGVDEKLYLQIDKPYYSAVDSIWFKGYLVDAITHTPFERTNFIYVELIDEESKVLSRVKVKRDSTGFSGYMKIDHNTKDGEYTLRGYTKWMSNKSSELFFERVISIISPISDESQSSSQSRAQSERRAHRSERMAEQALRDYHVTFFAEGGALIPSTEQVVAFKALAEDGLSVEISGEIYNSRDEKVADIASEGRGLGSFSITAEPNERYYALTTSNEEPKAKRFNLPHPDASALALSVSQIGGELFYQPIASEASLLEGLTVVVQSRGVVVAAQSVTAGSVYRIPKAQLLDGVTLFSVVNSAMEVVAERIIFNKPTLLPSVTIKSDSPNYGRRSKVSVELNVRGSDGLPVQGQFAVSVTDNSSVKRDSTKDSALSYLLLSSEIRGHIESPGLYFIEDSAQKDRELDLLMLTQGWRRYELEKLLRGELAQPLYPFEDYVRVSGRVLGLFGGSARKPSLNLFCLRPFVQEDFELTADNTFNLIGLDVPDSSRYILQAKGRFGASAVHLEVTPEEFPEAQSAILSRTDEVAPFAFMNQSREKFYQDGGLSTIDIESVVVTATRRDNVWGANPNFATHSVKREKIEQDPGFNMKNYLRMLPGMSVVGDSLYYRNTSVGVRFLVNDLDSDYLNMVALTTDHVEQIDFYFGNDASMFYENEGGVLCITLLPGVDMPDKMRSHVAHLMLLGYQQPKEFYQPPYDTPEGVAAWKQDLRTTLFWSGDITPDESGDMSFEFYTSDKSTTYTVILEGVTHSGEICYGEATINRVATN